MQLPPAITFPIPPLATLIGMALGQSGPIGHESGITISLLLGACALTALVVYHYASLKSQLTATREELTATRKELTANRQEMRAYMTSNERRFIQIENRMGLLEDGDSEDIAPIDRREEDHKT